MTDFKNKIVFITGASSGIGKSTALKFAERGADILMCARRLDRLTDLKQQLSSKFKINLYIVTEIILDKKGVFFRSTELRS